MFHPFRYGLFPRRSGIFVFLDDLNTRSSPEQQAQASAGLLRDLLVARPHALIVFATRGDLSTAPEWMRFVDALLREACIDGLAAEDGKPVKLVVKSGPNYALVLLGLALFAAAAALCYWWFVVGTAEPFSFLIVPPLVVVLGAALLAYQSLIERTTTFLAAPPSLAQAARLPWSRRARLVAITEPSHVKVYWTLRSPRSGSAYRITVHSNSRQAIAVAKHNGRLAAMSLAYLIGDILQIPIKLKFQRGDWQFALHHAYSPIFRAERGCPAFWGRHLSEMGLHPETEWPTLPTRQSIP
jgi:hypothetical protein